MSSVLAVAMMSCGGRAALEAYTNQSLAGPAGAGGSGVGGAGEGGRGGDSISVAVTTVSVGSTGSANPGCDGQNDCGACASCAFDTTCEEEADDCFSTPECEEFNDCLDECTDNDCFEPCARRNPEGAQLFVNMLRCVLCDACEEDCEDDAPPQLCGNF